MPPELRDIVDSIPAEDKHPFMNGIPKNVKDVPTDKQVADFRKWVVQQPNFPAITDNYLRLFLHCCYGKQPLAETTLRRYLKMRTKNPDIFSNRNPNSLDIQKTLNIAEFAMLPEMTQEGYKVVIYRLSDYDPNKIDFLLGVKTFLLINDVLLSEGGLVRGTIAIFDLKGVTLSHLTRLNLSALRIFMKYIQFCHPLRLKAMHVINTVPFIDKFLKIVKPFLRHGILSIVNFHPSAESLAKFIPKDILPEDYGGKGEKVINNYAHIRHLIENTYTSWLRDEEKFRLTCLDKTLCKEANLSSFKKLEID